MGSNRLLLRLAIALCAVLFVPAGFAQVVIDFGSGTNISTSSTNVHKEDGFTLTSSSLLPPDGTASTWRTAWSFADVASHGGSFPGFFSLTADDGSTFRLQRFAVADTTFDWTSSCHLPGGPSTTPSVDVTGRLGGAAVFTYTGRGPCPPGSGVLFGDASNPFAAVAVDELVFSAIGLEFVQADDIVLTAVPEPADYALVIAGLATLALCRSRRETLPLRMSRASNDLV